MKQPIWNFEQDPREEPGDETSINLRAYFDRMPDEKMLEYSADWTDEKVAEWDGNFRDDGCMMLFCCERDIEMDEYREVIAEAITYRERVRPTLVGSAE